ncbi:tripartite tricarboxylate transporter TctB family protein [Micromonospora sp. LOL_028]|uniref:tripartite tricarboxylate transporter TctB family protein n=1 Tax=Micromonospora sp. LOL_028 TaxID=3345420 RepID=UPI003A8A2E77
MRGEPEPKAADGGTTPTQVSVPGRNLAPVTGPSADPAPADPAPADPAPADQLKDTSSGEKLPPLGPVAAIIRRACLIGVLPAFSVIYLWQAMTITLPARTLIVSPRGFPTLLGVLMVIVTVAIAGTELLKIHRDRRARAAGTEVADDVDDETDRITSWRDAWATVAALVAYIMLFSTLGFLVSTALFLAGLSTYLTPKKWPRNVIVAVFFAGAVHLIFTELLGVQLPAGILTGLI